jgi:hypothetical protein
MDGVFMVYEPDGKIIPKGDLQLRPPASAWAVLEEKYGDAYRQWWSAEIRLKDMDRFGWDIQVLLPTGNNGNFAYRVALTDLEVGAAMCRAYNNWCRDYCSADPKRLKFVAVLPGSDVGEMVKEARRAVLELGAVSCATLFFPSASISTNPSTTRSGRSPPSWTFRSRPTANIASGAFIRFASSKESGRRIWSWRCAAWIMPWDFPATT